VLTNINGAEPGPSKSVSEFSVKADATRVRSTARHDIAKTGRQVSQGPKPEVASSLRRHCHRKEAGYLGI
jgi:hypothetical protein